MLKKESNNPWYVYIIKCSDNTLYTGITNNLESRIDKHNNGTGAKYTRGRGPVELLRAWVCESKSSAAKEEYRIKKLSKTQKTHLINS